MHAFNMYISCSAFLPWYRLVLWSGLDAGSVVLFDSGHGGPIPFEGVISEGPAVRVQFITDQPNSHNTGFNIRYEGRSVWSLWHKICRADSSNSMYSSLKCMNSIALDKIWIFPNTVNCCQEHVWQTFEIWSIFFIIIKTQNKIEILWNVVLEKCALTC